MTSARHPCRAAKLVGIIYDADGREVARGGTPEAVGRLLLQMAAPAVLRVGDWLYHMPVGRAHAKIGHVN